jgi:hypothetical protein
MLDLVGRRGDGWLPSLPYLQPGDLAEGNARIDRAARRAGRDPSAVRRLLNVGPDLGVADLAALVLGDGIDTLIVMADDPDLVRRLGSEVAPALRERVAAGRAGGGEGSRPPSPARTPVGPAAEAGVGEAATEYERLGVTPTPDDGVRVGAEAPWDESTRPHRAPSGPEVGYTRRGRLVGQHLIDVHDTLRRELTELRGILDEVREGAATAGEARSALNQMALRQNDWALGAFCSRYCGVVTRHHGIEDEGIMPHLRASEPSLGPVIDRLTEEHHVIHDAIQGVDRALVHHITHPGDFTAIQGALDLLTDALVSHLAYEEAELVEPLARHGFFAGQIDGTARVIPTG